MAQKEKQKSAEQIEHSRLVEELEDIHEEQRRFGDLTVHKGAGVTREFGMGGRKLSKVTYLHAVIQALEDKIYGTH